MPKLNFLNPCVLVAYDTILLIHVLYCVISTSFPHILAHLHTFIVQFNRCLVQVCKLVLQGQTELNGGRKRCWKRARSNLEIDAEVLKIAKFYRLNHLVLPVGHVWLVD